jgi:hypothetical protein
MPTPSHRPKVSGVFYRLERRGDMPGVAGRDFRHVVTTFTEDVLQVVL